MTTRVIPGQWRQGACLQDIEEVAGGNRDTQVAKRQRLYLKHYYNAPVFETFTWAKDICYLYIHMSFTVLSSVISLFSAIALSVLLCVLRIIYWLQLLCITINLLS